MTASGPDQPNLQLILRNRLSDIRQLKGWLESIASRSAIPEETQYAMNLCLEEAIANIIRHSYGREADLPIRVYFSSPSPGHFLFTVEDDATHFDPLAAPEIPALNPREEMRIGGHGIRLLRRFADTLEYQPTPAGNQLRIGFKVGVSK